MYARYLEWPKEWMTEFKQFSDECGIEWMCTVFLPADVAVIAPLVKRFKVAAKESGDKELWGMLATYEQPAIVSINHGDVVGGRFPDDWKLLHCVSEYPTPLDRLGLHRMDIPDGYDGLSDHTGHVLTGAVAVGAGARVIESHVRLWDTPEENPDYGHSLEVDRDFPGMSYAAYVDNIRTASRML